MAKNADDSLAIAVMKSCFGYEIEDLDNMVDARYFGLSQHLDRVEERRAFHLAKAVTTQLARLFR